MTFLLMSVSRKKLIINGDKAISYASYNGFQYVSYLDRKGEAHTGWVDSARITKEERLLEHLKVTLLSTSMVVT